MLLAENGTCVGAEIKLKLLYIKRYTVEKKQIQGAKKGKKSEICINYINTMISTFNF